MRRIVQILAQFAQATVLSLLFCGDLWALNVDINHDFTHQALGKGLEYRIDEGTQSNPLAIISESDWLLSEQSTLSFGFSNKTHWVRFNLHNHSDSPQNLIIETAYPFLDYLDLYLLNSNGDIQAHVPMGDHLPAQDRLIAHPHFLTPLTLRGNEQIQVLARIQTSSTAQIPLHVWESQHFLEAEYKRVVAYSLFYGLLLAISIYHFLIYLSVREKSFLYYSIFTFSTLTVFVCMEGIPSALLWPGITWASDYVLLLAICLAVISPSLFTIDILILRQARPRSARLLTIIIYAAAATALGSFVFPYQSMLKLALLLAAINLITNFIIHIVRFIDGYPPARYVFLAGICSCMGISTTILSTVGILPSVPLTEGAAYIGVVMMAMLYSTALSYRMNMDRSLREEAQLKLTRDLDLKVRERTEALELVNTKLMQASITDGLTELYNRRHFDDMLAQETKRAFRDKSPLSILLLDIDHFKKLNDNYGHQFGDLCLKIVAKTIKDSVRRPPDMVARYGGEEFVAILPNTDEEGAIYIAHNINQAVAAQDISDHQQRATLTVSIGVVSQIPKHPNQQESMLRQADQCLYRAKQNGRNRVEA